MTEQMQEIADFIVRKFVRHPTPISTNTPLVSSGLIDSLALVELLLKLEQVTNRRIPAGKVQAKDMDTIELMFATAQRVGKAREPKH